MTLAREVITLVAQYLPKAIENADDLEARYYLAYAAMLGGFVLIMVYYIIHMHWSTL